MPKRKPKQPVEAEDEERAEVYPRITIPDHLWIGLQLSLEESPHNARKILRDFCAIFSIPMAAVAARMDEEAQQLLADDRVLH